MKQGAASFQLLLADDRLLPNFQARELDHVSLG
jgi:hypothetical protein